MAERHKYLSGGSGNTSVDNTINDRSGAFYTNGMTQGQVRAETSSREALGQQRSGLQAKGASGNEDDEFWYNNGGAQ